MDLIEAIILGIVQGLTEFLPVSSSGHIEIVEYLMGDGLDQDHGMLMTVLLHVATALSTMIFFRDQIKRIIMQMVKEKDFTYALYIILSMIPAVVVGLVFDDVLDAMFNRQILLVASMLIVTGLLLLYADRQHITDKPVNSLRAIIIGIAQAVAVIPGISRSGATISTALLLNVDREQAAQFSFLMVIPLIFGKMAKDLIGESITLTHEPTYYIVGFICAFVVGLLACQFMVGIVKVAKLKYFSYYCFIIGGGILAFNVIGN